ncbi:MAG: hypothetical protein PHG75_08875 [Syntrophomonas sp.]|nr:hypothetical protein [Syntrophomonas sp.]
MSLQPPIFSNQSREDLAAFVDGARGFELNTSKEKAHKAFNEEMEINFRKLWQWRFNVGIILSAARQAKAVVSTCRAAAIALCFQLQSLNSESFFTIFKRKIL